MSSVTRTIIALHAKLWPRSFKANPSQFVVLLIFFLYGLPGALGLAFLTGDIALQENDLQYAAGLQGLGVFFYWLLALLYPSGESQVEPSRMATLPLRPRELAPGLLWTEFLQARTVLALLCTVATAVIIPAVLGDATSTTFVVAWALSCLVSFVLAVVGAAGMSGLGQLLGAQPAWVRYLVFAAGLVVAVVATFAVSADTTDMEATGTAVLRTFAWTPFAAPGSAVAFGVVGHWAPVVLMAVLTVALFFLAAWAQEKAIGVALHAPAEGESRKSSTSKRGAVLLPWAPRTRWGAIYSRALCYWWRDSRFRAQWASAVVLTAIFCGTGLAAGDPTRPYIGLISSVILCTTATANDYGYDGPANWVHLAAHVPAKTMVTARAAAGGTLGGATLLITAVISGFATGANPIFWTCLSVATCASLAGLGFAAVMAVFNPYPTSKPGTNAFNDRSGFNGAAILTSLIGIFGVWLPLVPGTIMMGLALSRGHASFADMASGLFLTGLALNVVLAVAVLVGGLAIAYRRLSHSWPDIFQRVRNYV
ncbi:hypothetical protein [Corynebacterium massiliense]|uniref:hypothetical protein n=1 Tax=Corynebacterium massiliense TaxID=441501 RepID=UPI0023568355|nr:hypothetical protein [Corynebacterium massiliense]